MRKVLLGRYRGNDSGSDVILTLISLRFADMLTIILHKSCHLSYTLEVFLVNSDI